MIGLLHLLEWLRWPVAAGIVLALTLMAARWGRLDGDYRSRLLGAALSVMLLATLIGTITALVEGKPGGGQVLGNAVGVGVTIWALLVRPTDAEDRLDRLRRLTDRRPTPTPHREDCL